jgi:hypothetical protein
MKKGFFVLLIFSPFFIMGQNQGNIWYFGNHAGLDFNNSNPVAITNGATYDMGSPMHSEGTSIICDNFGSLLFYTNGQKIWNKNHHIMPNGDSLLGNSSSTQAALIIPKPGSSRFFYVFTVDDFYNDNLQYGLRYSIIDICLDSGLGDVIKGDKNIKLLDTVAEKLTAVKHGNGIDYWIITHKYYSDAFYVYLLSSYGIIDTIKSHIGSRHPNLAAFQGTGASIGQLKASPNGQKLAIVNGNAGGYSIAEFFDFNNNTGIVSNCKSVQTNPVYDYYGVSFSSDNSILYITSCQNGNGIYQFNLNAGGGNPDSIRASKVNISSYFNFYALQLATNGKIYVTRAGIPRTYVGVINFPNILGANCNYIDSAICLNGKTASFGLPNFIDSYDYSNATYNCDNGINEVLQNKIITIYPNPANNSLIIDGLNSEAAAEIHDISGNLILKSPLLKPQIDISNLAEGMYFIKLNTAEGSVVRRFVKE